MKNEAVPPKLPGISYLEKGFSLSKRKSPRVYEHLLRPPGLQIVDIQTLKTMPGSRRAGLTITIPIHKGKAFLAQLIHPHGGVTWYFEKKKRGKKKTHVIEVTIQLPGANDRKRAVLPGTAVSPAGRYILVVLVSTLAVGLIKKGVTILARKWEEKRIKHALYSIDQKGVLKKNPLKHLPHHDGRRGLMFLHGALSSTEHALEPLLEERGRRFLETITSAYQGRVVGFDHPTISLTPEENARWLIRHVEKGKPCRYDIIAHSRGGLVARSLVEMVNEEMEKTGRQLIIDRVVLVGTPNQGTPLAAAETYEKLALWLGNVPPALPGDVLPIAVEFLGELLKYLAFGLPGTLPGIASLSPGSALLKRLNRPSPSGGTLYYGIGANFDAPRRLALKLIDVGLDKLFQDEDNDLVVPTEGCRKVDRPIPQERSALFSPYAAQPALKRNLHHFAFFRSAGCLSLLATFLGIPKQERQTTRRGSGSSGSASLPAVRRAEEEPRLPGMIEEKPDFTSAALRLDLAVVGDRERERSYRNWIKRWKKMIADAHLTSLPPEPFPFLMATSGLSRVITTFKTRGDETYWRSLIGTERSLRRYLEEAAPELSLSRIERAGKMLFKTLFTGEVRSLFDRTLSLSSGSTPLLVTFTSTSPWIADFPWEMVFDERKERFLSLGDICFFRGVISAKGAVSLPALPLVIRMLVAIAQPRDQIKLNALTEAEGLKKALVPFVESRRLYIDVLEHTTARSLERKLSGTSYHVLHYIGHGDYDEEADIGKLFLENAGGGSSDPVDAEALCEILTSRARYLRLVVLNGCETAEGGRADFNRGVAPALVAAGIPAVVGNRLIVGDSAAITFATTFYEELSLRKSLAEAAMTARRKLASSVLFEPFEWAVPIIFAIDPEARLF